MIFALKKILVDGDSSSLDEEQMMKKKYYDREIKAHSSLRHPFIVDYIDHFEEGHYKCILLKFIDCKLSDIHL